ncbi:hypothetical protein Q4577_08260 [Marinovum sp. 2_MG-2023]|nr:hypothetical protein [Marinovum sp. 2_MG-2023]MDO6779824.1 hypothetical protein [Marinovum sp. 1_MG-2023]
MRQRIRGFAHLGVIQRNKTDRIGGSTQRKKLFSKSRGSKTSI